jgi:hypothetical protein
MILNVSIDVFGSRYRLKMRNGDIVAVANVIEYLRRNNEELKDLKFYLMPDAVHPNEHVTKFLNFLIKNTDYFSDVPGQYNFNWHFVNLWDFRCISGDLLKFPNSLPMEKKIIVCPIFDATVQDSVGTYKNWPMPTFQSILNEFNTDEYKDYEKIIGVGSNISIPIDTTGWTVSTDFETNLNHIMTSEIFIGGDTGTSHFAWSLDRGPKRLIYYNSTRGLLNCMPFYSLQGKGEIRSYWLDFEGTRFQ